MPPLPEQDALVAQFAQALRNVLTVVRCAGGDPGDIMSLRIYVTGSAATLLRPKAIGGAYRAVLGRHYPTMALVQIADLLEDGALVGIGRWPRLPSRRSRRRVSVSRCPT